MKSISLDDYRNIVNNVDKKTRRKGIGQEDYMHIQFGALIKKYEKMGKLDCSFWSYIASGEKRTLKTGAMLKKKGLKPGQGDYYFARLQKKEALHYFLFLEFKTETGEQQQSQKDFEEIFRDKSLNVKYILVRSVEQAVRALEAEGFIKIDIL